MLVADRIAALEERVAALEARPSEPRGTEHAERHRSRLPGSVPRAGAQTRVPRAGVQTSPPAHPASSPPPSPSAPRRASVTGAATSRATPRRDLEDFLGGSVLAWLGGIAVLAGLAFLLTIAVSRGWIGEGARTALAGVLSLGLLGAGVWLRERKRRTEASLAAAAVGIAGLFGTLVVAGPVYDLVAAPLAFAGAFATGAFATALAIHWRAQVMGWLGLLGALWAPTALGAFDGGGMAFLAIAFAATIPVLVHQRWTTLAVFASVSTTLQWLAWELFDTPSTLALVVFGALSAALALGLEANRRGLHSVEIGPERRIRTHAIAVGLLLLNASILAAAGWEILDGEPWLAALAVAHVALGLAAMRFTRISRELALIVFAIGVVIADIAFASIATGLPLVIGWAASALPFAALLGRTSPLVDRVMGRPQDEASVRADRVLAMAGLVGQIALSGFQGLLFDAPPSELAGGIAPSTALAAAGAIALVAWACARLAGPQFRGWLDALALTAVAHFTGLALDDAALAATLAAEALALAGLARRNDDRYTAWAAVGFAGIALLHTLGTLAIPDALFVGLDAPLAAAGALAAVAAAVAAVSRAPLGVPNARRILEAGAALTLLYLVSAEVVTAAGPTLTGQTVLSVLWALAGVGALVRGLLIDDRPLRRGALVLLAVTIAKVFFYDLASLESLYRVGSLIGLGLLLLCGAFAWQQVRPKGAEAR